MKKGVLILVPILASIALILGVIWQEGLNSETKSMEQEIQSLKVQLKEQENLISQSRINEISVKNKEGEIIFLQEEVKRLEKNADTNQEIYDSLSILVKEVINPFNKEKNIYLYAHGISTSANTSLDFIESRSMCGHRGITHSCEITIGKTSKTSTKLGEIVYLHFDEESEIFFIDEDNIQINTFYEAGFNKLDREYTINTQTGEYNYKHIRYNHISEGIFEKTSDDILTGTGNLNNY